MALTKRLTGDLLHLQRRPAGWISNDAKSCFDRIVHWVAIISLMRFGIQWRTLRSMFDTLMKSKHWVRTGFGNSDRVFTPPTLIPFQGCGKGNRAGPPIWVAISSILLGMMISKGFGFPFSNPQEPGPPPLYGPSPTSQPPAPPSSILDLWHHFGSLAESGSHGWVSEVITIEGSEDRLVQALRAGTLCAVSDGSYKAKVGTVCAQILTDDRRDIIWITCQTPGKFDDQSSTCSELIDLMASLLVLDWMSQVAHLKLFASQPSVEMACDGLVALDKSFSKFHLSLSGAQFDLASTIRALLRHLPLQVHRRHVKGHLDKHRPFSQLDWWEQRNVEVDSKA
ncbi:unnamed protein product [Cylindrotheca closterium]|uniref:Uncharacterized protein n=1 Tax=Cylindrotheca closterium TaxID=2856 RepID=A0AAD2JL20_9STRA|nr:unnamed protein product [Cylindrotheca closterium]